MSPARDLSALPEPAAIWLAAALCVVVLTIAFIAVLAIAGRTAALRQLAEDEANMASIQLNREDDA